MTDWTPPETIVIGGQTWKYEPQFDNPEIKRYGFYCGSPTGNNFRTLEIDEHELKKIDGTFERELRELIDDLRDGTDGTHILDLAPMAAAKKLETILDNYKEQQ